MFYNTTSESGQQLLRYREIAMTQYDRVLDFFRQHPGELFGPSQVWRLTGLETDDVPITNIRRAMTDLTKDGWLVRTTIKRQGAWGRNEHCWVYPVERAA